MQLKYGFTIGQRLLNCDLSVSVRTSTTDLEDPGLLSFFKARSSEDHFVYNILLTKSGLLFKFIILSKPIFWHTI